LAASDGIAVMATIMTAATPTSSRVDANFMRPPAVKISQSCMITASPQAF
jgi:hypothetical protein